MKKKMLTTLLAGTLLCIALTACGGTDGSTDSVSDTGVSIENNTSDKDGADITADATDDSTQNENAEPKSFEEIYGIITESVELDAPMVVTEPYIMNAYGIDASTLDEYVFSLSESSISAETVILINAGSADADDIVDKLTTWKEYREAELQDYLPEQYSLVADSEVTRQGNYIWLVISGNSKQILEIINSNL